MPTLGSRIRIDRRSLLIGGGAAAGLFVAWGVWPRSFEPNLRAAPGETLFNAFLKIGTDGRVIVAIPQAEMGQGVFTSLPQIVADELGADWRAVAVEPAPINPLYANELVFGGADRPWILPAREGDARSRMMVTGGSTSVRAFEPRLRKAGAAARALLMQAAARAWGVEWEQLDTVGGFVVNGAQRLSFAELAAEASGFDVPELLPMRGGLENRLTGQSLPRIDLPSKVDGSAQFAADVRLPGMLFASVRQGPRGKSRLLRADEAAARQVPGVVRLFQKPGWAGAAATNWWAANQAVQLMKPVFEIEGPLASDVNIANALEAAAKEGEADRVFSRGDAPETLEGPDVIRVEYSAGIAPNAALESLTATARFKEGRLEVWAPAQAQGLARAAAARAAGISDEEVTLYPMLVGSGYGRKLETTAIEQAATMAMELERPVQLTWSRPEELAQDTFRPPAKATLSARLTQAGTIAAWHARIAAPDTRGEVWERIGSSIGSGSAAAVDGATPPYDIPTVAVDHVPVEIGVTTGLWRSAAHSYTAFFNECFVDELARKAGLEPFSYRMQMLGQNPRLAMVLSTATALGGWDGGGAGSAMGVASHSAFGSHVATLVEVAIDEQQSIRVTRAFVAVDCGRVVNPEIVRQLVEGGTIYGIAGATGNPIRLENGLTDRKTLNSLRIPRLSDSPEVTVEILPSEEEPGGVTELAVPPVAPAIANAVFALTGQRLRSLPLIIGNTA